MERIGSITHSEVVLTSMAQSVKLMLFYLSKAFEIEQDKSTGRFSMTRPWVSKKEIELAGETLLHLMESCRFIGVISAASGLHSEYAKLTGPLEAFARDNGFFYEEVRQA